MSDFAIIVVAHLYFRYHAWCILVLHSHVAPCVVLNAESYSVRTWRDGVVVFHMKIADRTRNTWILRLQEEQ